MNTMLAGLKIPLLMVALATASIGCSTVSPEQLEAAKQELKADDAKLRQDLQATEKKLERANEALGADVAQKTTAARTHVDTEIGKLKTNYDAMLTDVAEFKKRTDQVDAIILQNQKLYAHFKTMLDRQLELVTTERGQVDNRIEMLKYLEQSLRTTIGELNKQIPNNPNSGGN